MDINFVDQSVKIISITPDADKLIELAGRTCYKSEDKITENSSDEFIRKIIVRGHHSVLEHAYASVRFIMSRIDSQQVERHRLASFSQSSQRYINLANKGFEAVRPIWFKSTCEQINKIIENNNFNYHVSKLIDQYISGIHFGELLYLFSICNSFERYNELVTKYNWKPEQARGVLPEYTKTELIMSANFREWNYILNLRSQPNVELPFRTLVKDLSKQFNYLYPTIFPKYE